MIVRLLLVLCLVSPCFGVTVRVDTLKDLTNAVDGKIYDTYIKGGTDSVTNNGFDYSAEVNNDTRTLIRTGNLRQIIGEGQRIMACTLAFVTGTEVQNTRGGGIGAYRVLKEWWEGHGYPREGALWNYRQAPLFPDTTPTASLPSSFSWADSALDTDPKAQGSCGCCYAIATAAAFETAAKVQGSERDLSYNSGNGTGADRRIAPSDTIHPTGAGWVKFDLNPAQLMEAYSDPTNKEAGWALICVSGNYTFKTSESGGSSVRPIFAINYEVDSGGFGFEYAKRITGTTSVSETMLKSGSDSTTNFGSDTTINLTTSNNVMLIKINNISTIFGGYVTGFAASCCSVYVQSVTTEGRSNAVGMLKKWDESQATWTIWKTGYRWSSQGAGKLNELDVSEQQLLNCSPDMGCSGGTPSLAFEYWRLNGVFSEESYPYEATDALSCTDTAGKSLSTRLTWWWYADGRSRKSLKQMVMIRPISVVIDNYANAASAYPNECFVGTPPYTSGVHEVLLLGYDDSYTCGDSTGAWLVRNSYGTSWGDYGRAWYSYGNNPPLKVVANYPNLNIVMAETQDTPVMWDSPGMGLSTDFNTTAVATTTVTTAEETTYKMAIPADLVQHWYTYPEQNYGLVLRPTIATGSDTAEVYIGLSGPNTGRPPTSKQPYFIITSCDCTTNIGGTSIGNSNIGH